MNKQSEWKYGEVLKGISLSGYKFTETAYESDVNLLSHSHDFAYFCFILQGAVVERRNKKQRIYKPTNLIYHPLAETHSNYFYAKSRCFNFQLKADNSSLIPYEKRLVETTRFFEKGKIIHLAGSLYREICEIDEFSGLTVEGLILEILAESLRNPENGWSKNPPRWLSHIKEKIDEDPTNCLTMDLLASSENVHPVHLAKEFRRYYKCTTGDYIRKKRIGLACQQLVSSKIPIKEIALETGFFDQSHFTRVFKKAIGTTPLAYRNTFAPR